MQARTLLVQNPLTVEFDHLDTKSERDDSTSLPLLTALGKFKTEAAPHLPVTVIVARQRDTVTLHGFIKELNVKFFAVLPSRLQSSLSHPNALVIKPNAQHGQAKQNYLG